MLDKAIETDREKPSPSAMPWHLAKLLRELRSHNLPEGLPWYRSETTAVAPASYEKRNKEDAPLHTSLSQHAGAALRSHRTA